MFAVIAAIIFLIAFIIRVTSTATVSRWPRSACCSSA